MADDIAQLRPDKPAATPTLALAGGRDVKQAETPDDPEEAVKVLDKIRVALEEELTETQRRLAAETARAHAAEARAEETRLALVEAVEVAEAAAQDREALTRKAFEIDEALERRAKEIAAQERAGLKREVEGIVAKAREEWQRGEVRRLADARAGWEAERLASEEQEALQDTERRRRRDVRILIGASVIALAAVTAAFYPRIEAALLPHVTPVATKLAAWVQSVLATL